MVLKVSEIYKDKFLSLNMTLKKEGYQEYKLKNGLKVALLKTPTQTVSCLFRIWHSALYESKKEHGIAHFLEHILVTGGTKKYNPETVKEIIGKFGYFNAYTSLFNIYFQADILKEDLEMLLDLLAEQIFYPRFDKLKINEERQRILREISDIKSHPAFDDGIIYKENFYGKNSPYIYFVPGDESLLKTFQLKDFEKFHKSGFLPNIMDIIIVGSLPKNIKQLIEKYFGKAEKGKSKRISIPKQKNLTEPVLIESKAPELLNSDNPENSTAHLDIIFIGPNDADENRYLVNFLTHILGGDSQSLLFTK